MAVYEKQNFRDGQVLTAEHLNHIEDGIVAACSLFEDDKKEIINAVIAEICNRLKV